MDPDPQPPAVESAEPPGREVAASQALTIPETLQVTCRVPAIVVGLLGPVGCGKTTLIATIYDQFQLGTFAGWLFAGSETLLGFERRSHLSRLTSGEATATTERTKIGEGERYLHLRVQDDAQAHRVNEILVADISGEVFTRLLDRPEGTADVASLGAAHVLGFLVDGERLASNKYRHSVSQDTRMLLRTVVQGLRGSQVPLLQLIVTKWDLLAGSGGSDEAAVRSELAGILPAASPAYQVGGVFVTAARPGARDVPWAYGCGALLSSWASTDVGPPRRSSLAAAPTTGRHFDRFRAAN